MAGGKAKQGGNLVHLLNSIVFRSLSDAASFLHLSGDGCRLIHIVCRSILLSINVAICILSFLPRLPIFPSRPGPSHCGGGLTPRAESTSAGRALCHVLSAVVGVPVASRKHGLVRSLAERILEDNLCSRDCGGGPELCDLNRAALCTAFASTIGLLEEALAAGRAPPPWNETGGSILGSLGSMVGGWLAPGREAEPDRTAEKLAAEASWLAQKMAENGAAAEAVTMWAEASDLAALAVSAEPRVQVALVRVCAFMLKQANSRKLEAGGGKGAAINSASSHSALLRSWLPLLCRACSGVDAPALSGGEKAETVCALEDLVWRLGREEQESILSLWLHHFTACPDSDWPNLETCYMRWYSECRKFLLKERKIGDLNTNCI